jgi:hypothetical protein
MLTDDAKRRIEEVKARIKAGPIGYLSLMIAAEGNDRQNHIARSAEQEIQALHLVIKRQEWLIESLQTQLKNKP